MVIFLIQNGIKTETKREHRIKAHFFMWISLVQNGV